MIQIYRWAYNHIGQRHPKESVNKVPLVKCECGCDMLFSATEMRIFINSNGGVDRIYSLHARQIWGYDNDNSVELGI